VKVTAGPEITGNICVNITHGIRTMGCGEILELNNGTKVAHINGLKIFTWIIVSWVRPVSHNSLFY